MPVLHPSLSRVAYARLLSQLQAVVGPLEARLLTLPFPPAFELHLRLKAPLLTRDLGHLPSVSPTPPTVPQLAGVSEGLGALYVLEGATLGGQVIARHLQRNLNIQSQSGSAYFHAYGAATGPMWLALTEAMNRGVAPEDEEDVIAGAQHTFELFHQVLKGVSA
ncbi:biliverdin-producing heme oxygenase [Deinococcus humi]|uniref:Heme oxygenase n=1 Tax=Deinococcus humi TaxID=662880 RepID=A0A7W8JZH4_9DEIO|nr:biliverdin-producing heme oxygenase [Deinococcus humi]MBB5366097.1 heme oxygenase [Deinococcus humi]GGO40119.1 heme oxygenase [Deinococcus humi]